MPSGFGRGRGRGFGFRGSSPPWPYVGIGRGGLPRHEYFLSGATGAPAQWPYQQAPYAAASPAFSNVPLTSQITPEQELDFLRNQAEAIGEQLEQIETRMHSLESER